MTDNVIEFPDGVNPKESPETTVELKIIEHPEYKGRLRRSDCPLWVILNNIVVKPLSRFTTRGDGIVIPTAGEYYVRGTVVATGEGQIDDKSTRMPMHVRIGDSICLPNPCGVEIDGFIAANEVNTLAIDVPKEVECQK